MLKKLKIPCKCCRGRGGWWISGEYEECEMCGGSGEEDPEPKLQEKESA